MYSFNYLNFSRSEEKESKSERGKLTYTSKYYQNSYGPADELRKSGYFGWKSAKNQ